MDHSVEFLVASHSRDEHSFAKVYANVSDEKLKEERPFFHALRGALTQWMRETEEGQKAKKAYNNFNVVDFSEEIGEETMMRYIAKAGIKWIQVAIEAHEPPCRDWSLCTPLVDWNLVEEKKP